MVIAIPVTMISAIGAANRLGVAVTSGAAFEELGTIRTVALDKTGTLTHNELRVVEVRTAPGSGETQVLAITAALEASGSHPLATAVTAAATSVPDTTDVTETSGHELTGTVEGRPVRVGGDRWIDPGDLAEDATGLAEQGMSLVVVEVDGEVAGVVGVRDELRPEDKERYVRDSAARTPTAMIGDGINDTPALASATVGIALGTGAPRT